MLIGFLKRVYHATVDYVKSLGHVKSYRGNFMRLSWWKYWSTVFPSMLPRYWKTYNGVLKKTLEYPDVTALPAVEPVDRMRVWVMWWQGEEGMPALVRRTFASIKEHSLGMEVVLISRENVGEYVKLPKHIVGRIESGSVTFTTLSDYVRFYLLSNYGGVWVDSTMLFTQDMPRDVIEREFFTIKRVRTASKVDVSRSRWNGQFLSATVRHYRVFEMMRLLWESYWREFDWNLEYFTIDHLVSIVYDKDSVVREVIDNVEPSNEELYQLMSMLNETFSAQTWKEIVDSQPCHKLSYKVKANDNKESYLHKLERGEI